VPNSLPRSVMFVSSCFPYEIRYENPGLHTRPHGWRRQKNCASGPDWLVDVSNGWAGR
jgi:hypothetical protein